MAPPTLGILDQIILRIRLTIVCQSSRWFTTIDFDVSVETSRCMHGCLDQLSIVIKRWTTVISFGYKLRSQGPASFQETQHLPPVTSRAKTLYGNENKRPHLPITYSWARRANQNLKVHNDYIYDILRGLPRSHLGTNTSSMMPWEPSVAVTRNGWRKSSRRFESMTSPSTKSRAT